MIFEFTRRHLLAGLALLAAPVEAASSVVVHRDPGYDCCEKWTALTRIEFRRPIRIVDNPDRSSLHRQFDIPTNMISCHTAMIDELAFEGHVPLSDVKRLLVSRPRGVLGLTVTGMPPGSPGMEVPRATPKHFTVMTFGTRSPTIYARH